MSGATKLMLAMSGAPGAVDLPASIDATINFSGIAQVELQNDGDWTSTNQGPGEWVTPSDSFVAIFYEARASSASGDTGSAIGTFDTWLSLSTTRAWGVSGTDKLLTFTLEIREAGTGVVRDSCSVTCATAS